MALFESRRARRRRLVALAEAVEHLPRSTRTAMLAAVRRDRIIAGAYTDSNGGACPMLASHRRGARSEGREFAAAWDAFAGAGRGRPRPATRRQLRDLRRILLWSLQPSWERGSWLRPVTSYDEMLARLAALGVEHDLAFDDGGSAEPSTQVHP